MIFTPNDAKELLHIIELSKPDDEYDLSKLSSTDLNKAWQFTCKTVLEGKYKYYMKANKYENPLDFLKLFIASGLNPENASLPANLQNQHQEISAEKTTLVGGIEEDQM